MKKILLFIITVLIFCPKTFANQEDMVLLAKNGFFEKASISYLSPYDEIKKIVYLHLKYSNNYDLEGLKALYAKDYISCDGLNKELFFDLVKKTWISYPDIKYKVSIDNIDIGGNFAVVQLSETAFATTNSKSSVISQKGLLESISNTVYYLEKTDNEWKITSDHINFEKTFLRYGSAQTAQIDLAAPCQIYADKSYTAMLNIVPPKDSLVIASIGREKITYPQTVAEEVFRKLPQNGVLERMFKANNSNINEYAVASFGITKAEIKNSTDIKIYITGLGFVMSRVNVIPENKFIKVENNEKIQ